MSSRLGTRPRAGRLLLATGVVCTAATLAGAESLDPAATKDTARRDIVLTTTAEKPLEDAVAQVLRSRQPATITFNLPPSREEHKVTLTRSIAIEGDAVRIRLDAGKCKAPLVIDATRCSDAALIAGGSAELELAGLTIRGGKQRVVLCKDRARLTLDNVTVTGGSMPGVAAFGYGRVFITDSRLNGNNTHGLELHGDTAARLERVDLNQNSQSGIAAFDSAKVHALRCRMEANSEWGIVLNDRGTADLTSCTISRSRFANCDISASATLTATTCELLAGSRFGLFATGKSTIQLTDTRVARNASRGIEAQDRTTLTLSNCRIESSGDYGMILFGETQVTATETSFNNNAAHGASLRGNASGTFTRCAFVANRFSGLGCLDGADGGAVLATQCVFQRNGMRPIYRGPLHLDPAVPTPLRIEGSKVQCLADPKASIELYVDRAGEASRYLTTLQADTKGRFEIDASLAPAGYVITAAATVNGATSEFNVVAASPSAPVLNALLGRTGPLSDDGGEINLDMLVRRWRPGTKVIFNLERVPSPAVERYVTILSQRLRDWTGGGLTAEVVMGAVPPAKGNICIVPVHYLDADAQQLASRGGVTYMRWDSSGFFTPPMEIMLALARDPQETCPRVLAHEVGHALGLCHARVGLLSRMQGSAPPGAGFVNDFSPMMTYYDVLALQALHDPRNKGALSLRQLVQRGAIPAPTAPQIADATAATLAPTFSPPADPLHAPSSNANQRP